jgi:hypothetical protein
MALMVLQDVQTRAQAALCNSPFYELRELLVEPREDGLLLSGGVSSFYHKQLAQEVVRSVSTGIKLVNTVQVNSEDDGR